MTLQQVASRYGISPSFLENKEDAIRITIKSIEELADSVESKKSSYTEIHAQLVYLKKFLMDVKESTMY